MRRQFAATVRRGVQLLAAGLPAFLLLGSLEAQVGPASVATSSATSDPASEGSSSTSGNDLPGPPGQSEGTSTEPVESGVEGLDFAHGVPPGSFGEEPSGVPYSGVFVRPEVETNPFNALTENPFPYYVYPANIGGAEGTINFSLLDTGGIHFLQGGTEPENADIKAGPFFVKFHYLNGIGLYDDNFARTETGRRAARLILLSLNLTIIAQLSEDLEFVASGSLAYLPLQNQFGIAPSAYYNELGMFLGAVPVFASRFAYTTDIASWPVVFSDTFRAGEGTYTDNVGNDFDLLTDDSIQRDQEGNYTFRSAPNLRGQNSTVDSVVQYYTNGIGASTSQMLLGDLRFTADLEHEDFWYNQSNRGLPPSRDEFYASLVSQRDNLRFKPYLAYQAVYVQDQPGVVQEFEGGIFGPIDDQISLNAGGGVYSDAFGHNGVLYDLRLTHLAGPYTTEEVSVDSYLSAFNQGQTTAEYYRLTQILGPTLSASLFLDRSSLRDLAGGGEDNHTDNLGGLEFTWDLGPKTSVALAGIFDQQRYSGGEKRDTTTGRVTLNRMVTDDLTFQLLYQYQHSVANGANDNYLDNIFYLSIVKYFH